jgi:nucleoside 2-deoxyribosyltransferase
MKIYLAGPEVFLPDAAAVGATKIALCRAMGFTGLYALAPDDPPPPDAPAPARAAAIFRNCIAQMTAADGAIANLTPFRGLGADPGTAFEVGYMVAAGKPVFAYTNDGGSLEARVRAAAGGRLDRSADGELRDPEGLAVEAFGLAENLMLACATAAPIVIHTAEPADRYRDLTGFKQCLEHVRASLSKG